MLASLFTCIIYDKYLKNLSKGKVLGLDNISNDILKALPSNFHNMFSYSSYNAITKNPYQKYGNIASSFFYTKKITRLS